MIHIYIVSSLQRTFSRALVAKEQCNLKDPTITKSVMVVNKE